MGFRMPPEWAPQDWLWIGFPHDPDEWGDAFAPAQEEIAGFANAIAESGQQVRLLVRDAANEARAKALVTGMVRLERRTYGDVWLRDTGPLVLCDGSGNRAARRFGFNGWGGKYLMEGDQTVGAELAEDTRIGNFVETKKATIGTGSRRRAAQHRRSRKSLASGLQHDKCSQEMRRTRFRGVSAAY